MTKPLIIVESPTKIKTLKKYVGKQYNVAASAGHIRDLPVKTLGIDIEKKFKAKYVNIKDKSKVISNLKKLAQNTDEIFLAPDPDREGEAIAFHVMHILKKKNRHFHRILIHELTKKGIQDALQNPMEPDIDKYDAQQARRKLDRLVGYQISPLLWKKVQRGLSAGRVQSVAVKIICDRERKIRKFIPEEFWTITADLLDQFPPDFNAGEYFKYAIGIIAPEGLPPLIKLAVQKTQAQYLITQPWHDSQNIEKENEEQVVFSFRVHPTYEFRSLVLSLGKDAYIQEPASLREEMKKELVKMLGYY